MPTIFQPTVYDYTEPFLSGKFLEDFFIHLKSDSKFSKDLKEVLKMLGTGQIVFQCKWVEKQYLEYMANQLGVTADQASICLDENFDTMEKPDINPNYNFRWNFFDRLGELAVDWLVEDRMLRHLKQLSARKRKP